MIAAVTWSVVAVPPTSRVRTPACAGQPGSAESSLRAHIGLTYVTLTRRGRLLPIVALAMLTGVVLQMVLEFGPLWLVALAVPAVLYGPYWAALVSSLGLGGLIAGRIHLDQPRTATAVAALM